MKKIVILSSQSAREVKLLVGLWIAFQKVLPSIVGDV